MQVLRRFCSSINQMITWQLCYTVTHCITHNTFTQVVFCHTNLVGDQKQLMLLINKNRRIRGKYFSWHCMYQYKPVYLFVGGSFVLVSVSHKQTFMRSACVLCKFSHKNSETVLSHIIRVNFLLLEFVDTVTQRRFPCYIWIFFKRSISKWKGMR